MAVGEAAILVREQLGEAVTVDVGHEGNLGVAMAGSRRPLAGSTHVMVAPGK